MKFLSLVATLPFLATGGNAFAPPSGSLDHHHPTRRNGYSSTKEVPARHAGRTVPTNHGIVVLQLQSTPSSPSPTNDEPTRTRLEENYVSSFFEKVFDTIHYRVNLFRTAFTQDGYNLKQSMAIAIAGDEYDPTQVRQEIQTILDLNPCVLFTWEASPSCQQAIKALESMNHNSTVVDFEIVRLDNPWSEGNKLRAELGKMTGKSSVPSIWIGGVYVGGYDAGVSEEAPGLVQMAFQGTLRPKLEQAGALKMKL
jgi:glutaredoxin-related protein